MAQQNRGESLYDERWMLLKEMPGQMSAGMLMDLLSQAGIPSYKIDQIIGHYWQGRGTSCVYVKACDRDMALAILSEFESASGIPEEELEKEALETGDETEHV